MEFVEVKKKQMEKFFCVYGSVCVASFNSLQVQKHIFYVEVVMTRVAFFQPTD
jgi:hypothetical protein